MPTNSYASRTKAATMFQSGSRVEHDGDPAAVTDVRRAKEARRIGFDQRFLRAHRRRQMHR